MTATSRRGGSVAAGMKRRGRPTIVPSSSDAPVILTTSAAAAAAAQNSGARAVNDDDDNNNNNNNNNNSNSNSSNSNNNNNNQNRHLSDDCDRTKETEAFGMIPYSSQTSSRISDRIIQGSSSNNRRIKETTARMRRGGRLSTILVQHGLFVALVSVLVLHAQGVVVNAAGFFTANLHPPPPRRPATTTGQRRRPPPPSSSWPSSFSSAAPTALGDPAFVGRPPNSRATAAGLSTAVHGGSNGGGRADVKRAVRATARKPLDVPPAVLKATAFARTKKLIDTTAAPDNSKQQRNKYQRKRIPESEREVKSLRNRRQAEYERLMERSDDGKPPSIWSFESLFPDPVWDETSRQKDLYEQREKDAEITKTKAAKQYTMQQQQQRKQRQTSTSTSTTAVSGVGNTLPFSSWDTAAATATAEWDRTYQEELRRKKEAAYAAAAAASASMTAASAAARRRGSSSAAAGAGAVKPTISSVSLRNGTLVDNAVVPPSASVVASTTPTAAAATGSTASQQRPRAPPLKIDRGLTRMVEDRIYGYRRTAAGTYEYDTRLSGSDGAVQFREGVRLGNPLKINADRLTYLAKKEYQHGRIEEASELYEQALEIDPRDGRAYLGLSRCAERRRDFKLARHYLQMGIKHSVAEPVVQQPHMQDQTNNNNSSPSSLAVVGETTTTSTTGGYNACPPDRGPNPFLLQAMGFLEEKSGRLREAEAYYLQAIHSRPSHAAAWVSLAQLRTRKLGQSVAVGRQCYMSAVKEMQIAGVMPSSYVYTAWGNLEFQKGNDAKKARELFKLALEVDPKCSAAWLQLGVMEASKQNYKEAQACFENILKFDQRNSRALQAYAIMESTRPDGSSRKAIDLFEKALKANRRDAGVLQAYALYVADKFGDIDSARALLQQGTQVNKRHAPVWQAWGVLETRHGTASEARGVFQQGIWACAQVSGNQSGGYHCTRLWQAWGCLEAREGDYAAARRCFSRALDSSDSRNIPTIIAWSQMEEQLGQIKNARSIFEQSLPKFAPGSDEKMSLWRNYELMEQRIGDLHAAQQVYQRSMREAMTVSPSSSSTASSTAESDNNNRMNSAALGAAGAAGAAAAGAKYGTTRLNSNNEVEVVRWDGGNGGERIWLNDRAIEGKMPGKVGKSRNGGSSQQSQSQSSQWKK